MTAPLAGLVLCGGRSRRMGTDKALLPVSGRPLVVAVAERIATVASPVLLAPGTPGRLGTLGFAEVSDPVPWAGPLAGLVAGLEASPHPLLAVVAVDMPLASPAVLQLLAGLHQNDDAVVPVTSEGPQPLHAVYSAAALPMLGAALNAGRYRMLDVLESLRVRWVDEPGWRGTDPDGRFALNLNRVEDLALLE